MGANYNHRRCVGDFRKINSDIKHEEKKFTLQLFQSVASESPQKMAQPNDFESHQNDPA